MEKATVAFFGSVRNVLAMCRRYGRIRLLAMVNRLWTVAWLTRNTLTVVAMFLLIFSPWIIYPTVLTFQWFLGEPLNYVLAGLWVTYSVLCFLGACIVGYIREG